MLGVMILVWFAMNIGIGVVVFVLFAIPTVRAAPPGACVWVNYW